MNKQKLEKLTARIALIDTTDGNEDTPFAYINNREHFDELDIPVAASNNNQFIEVDDELTYEEQNYKVKKMNFIMQDAMNFKGLEFYNEDENKYELSEFNCTINIFLIKV